MATLEQLMKEAESLSRDDREMLAVHLFATLEEDRDPGYEEAWAAEIERRVRETDEGRGMSMKPWTKLRDELLARVDRA